MKLSVLMATYNHEKFIAQALDSVLMQEVNFDYEIVIGEDCSADHTGEIVREYAAKHPDKIRMLPREKNLGGRKNMLDVYANCRGEYIAMLEGDDFWVSPHKLQKQVDLLDSRPELSSCFCAVRYVDEEGLETRLFYPPKRLAEYKLKDIAGRTFIMTNTFVFRKALMNPVPEQIKTAPVGDWLIHCYLAQFGNIGYIDEVMGAYRIHPGGVFFHVRSDKARWLTTDIRCLIALEAMVSPENKALFPPHIAHSYYTLVEHHLSTRNYAQARQVSAEAWKFRKSHDTHKPLRFLKLRVKSVFPFLDVPIRAAERIHALSMRIRKRLTPS